MTGRDRVGRASDSIGRARAGERIIAFTPNPAIDRTVEIGRPLVPHELHRVTKVCEDAGGKGVNLARVVAALLRSGDGEGVTASAADSERNEGSPVEVLTAGFLAGWNGRKFRELLAAEGIEGRFLEVEGETRECQILLAGDGHPTELYESGATVGVDEWRELLSGLPAGQLVLSGSLPPGIRLSEFRSLLVELPEPPVVDAAGQVLLAALEARVRLVAPNRAELAGALGKERAGVEDAQGTFKRYRVPVLLSLGADGAAFVGDRSYRAEAPEVRVRNPVGSGDALLGGFLWALTAGLGEKEALRIGVAAGAASAAAGGPRRVSREQMIDLREVVDVEEIW